MSLYRTATAFISSDAVQLATVEVSVPTSAAAEAASTSLTDASLTRVHSAFANSCLRLPGIPFSVRYAPGPTPSGAAPMDLAAAAALWCAAESQSTARLAGAVFIAELGLDGGLRPVPGIDRALVKARDAGAAMAVVAPDDAAEAASVAGLEVYAPNDLATFTAWMHGQVTLAPVPPASASRRDEHGGQAPAPLVPVPAPRTPGPGLESLPWFARLAAFEGAQLAYGFDLGPIVQLFAEPAAPSWIRHPEGPAFGACTALLDAVGVSDPMADEAATLQAWRSRGIDLAPYGTRSAPGWVLAATTYVARLDEVLTLDLPHPLPGAVDRLTDALEDLGLADRFGYRQPSWVLCGRADRP